MNENRSPDSEGMKGVSITLNGVSLFFCEYDEMFDIVRIEIEEWNIMRS